MRQNEGLFYLGVWKRFGWVSSKFECIWDGGRFWEADGRYIRRVKASHSWMEGFRGQRNWLCATSANLLKTGKLPNLCLPS